MTKSKHSKRPEVRIANFPKFKSEAEEAEWWDRNQDFVSKLFQKAYAGKKFPSQSITIRLPASDLLLARQAALDKGVGYQTLIKSIIREGLARLHRS